MNIEGMFLMVWLISTVLTLMIFALALIATVGYQIKYRNIVELCEWKNGLGDNRVEKVCREVLLEKK